MCAAHQREERRHPDSKVNPPRTDFERDRDRILHSTALRRLASITQVVSAAEGHVFHNRLTHVLKVAQIARGLAEHLLHDQENQDLARSLGGLDPCVVEAAALAHDLGHPPFGHIAEEELDALLREEKVSDGFEGNAQSFRIVTKTSIRCPESDGLNLTAATLAALLKYPWFRQTGGGKKEYKWGAYRSEEEDFHFARAFLPNPEDDRRSLEAELMDWADDVAYSICDLDDFFRADKIPLHLIFNDTNGSLSEEAESFLASAFERWQGLGNKVDDIAYRDALKTMVDARLFTLHEAYDGSKEHRGLMRTLTSTLIRRYLNGVVLDHDAVDNKKAPRVRRIPHLDREIQLLKELTWQYVIANPALVRMQYGQRQIIRKLFEVFMDAASSPTEWNLFPFPIQENLAGLSDDSTEAKARVVSDFIAGLTEQQAFDLHQRLTGTAQGTVLYSTV